MLKKESVAISHLQVSDEGVKSQYGVCVLHHGFASHVSVLPALNQPTQVLHHVLVAEFALLALCHQHPATLDYLQEAENVEITITNIYIYIYQ